MTISDFQQVCYDSLVTTSMTYRVTLHGYVTCSYAGYAKHGYATWLCHMWLRRLCQNLVTPHGYATYSHVVYALHDYSTWLRRLRQIWLRHMVTPCMHGHVGYAIHGYSTWLRYPVRLVGLIGNSSLHDIRNIMRQQKNCVVVT